MPAPPTPTNQTQTHTVTVGSVGGTPITVNPKAAAPVSGGDPWAWKRVTLTQNYTAINPPGWPDRPPSGVSAPNAWKPGLIPAGATRYFPAHEADALVSAGAANYS